jgi:stage V sporulation protein S
MSAIDQRRAWLSCVWQPRRLTIETLRVSGTSRPNSVAGAIAALLRNEGEVEVQAIGPHAVNQAVKAIAIARSYIEADGIDLTTKPSFVKLELQNEERTAVRFAVHRVDRDETVDSNSPQVEV